MRQRTKRHFRGSLFSRQIIYAYGIAAGFTAAFQQLLVIYNYFASIPQNYETLPVFIELYVETLYPMWIGGITAWNIYMIFLNLCLAVILLAVWTARYAETF